VGLFDRLFGRDDMRAARQAELTGDLARAVVLWALAGRPDEAARVMILRGDSEPDPRVRLQHYTQAAATAPALHDTNRQARQKRALLTMTLAGDAAISTVARADVLEAAKDLEAIGDPAKAAAQLGWKPKVRFKELVKIMVDHDLELAKRESQIWKLPRT